ncbi:MAG TPA: 50S ribosomal protein L11 methyltransferase [Bacillota bacterium]|jgi:ribosomal protein L11 methyltransferase
MKWTEVRVLVASEAAEAVANALIEEGAGGVAIQDPSFLAVIERGWFWGEGEPVEAAPPSPEVTVAAHYPRSESLGPRLERLRRRLDDIAAGGLDLGPGRLTAVEVDEADWVDAWKTYFKPHRLGRRMVIRPSWEEYEADPTDLVIVVDPGMAFGTGTHATTSGCLLFLEEQVKGGESVVDCGCGSGILAVAAARLGAATVLAVDHDEVAVAATTANADANGVAGTIRVVEDDGGAFLAGLEPGSVDLVTANLTADPLVRLAPDLARALKAGGKVIASGIIRARRNEVVEAFGRAGLELVDERRDGDWHSLLASAAGSGPARKPGHLGVTGRA